MSALAFLDRFFMGDSDVHRALTKLVAILEAEKLPYAIIGALALAEYGHKRATVDVALVMTDESLAAFKARHLGHGYAERVEGTGKLIDTEYNVHVDVLSSGRFPGDGKPKPIAFPDPAGIAVRGPSFAMLPMARFIELKLASGMAVERRLKDLADVMELIKSAKLALSVADDLDPSVREKFKDLWRSAQIADPYE